MANTASSPKDKEGGSVHLRIRRGDVPPYAILPGDPARTLLISKDWDDAREIAYNREFRTVTGVCGGVPLCCSSTGVGAASSEICIHELHEAGVHTCVRVGTTGCIQPDIALGDLVIPYACVRRDGTSDAYIEPAYPAAAHPHVLMALIQACENLGYKYRLGIGYTVSSFYAGQGRPLSGGGEGYKPPLAGDNGENHKPPLADDSGGSYKPSLTGDGGEGYKPPFTDDLIPYLRSAGVTNIEMEAAGQFVVGSLHGMRMGAILAVVANRVTDEWGDKGGEEKACKAAVEAVRVLSKWDAEGRADLSAGI